MTAMTIHRLQAGGLITTYFCNSRCGHCLYNCGPGRGRGYMSPEAAGAALAAVRGMGCASVHIGGGEPMFDIPGLLVVMAEARRAGVAVEYVETNSAWYRGRGGAVETLKALRAAGLSTLLVSISPFHNGAVPMEKVRGVIAACREADIRIFPWVNDFFKDLSRFDESRPHGLEEYLDRFGEDYLSSVLRRYWIHLGGRALATFRPVLPTLTAGQIRLKHAKSCRAELSDTTHFHVDLYGGYIPGLCSGLAFPAALLGGTLDEHRFPILNLLWNDGIRGLFDWASQEHGFTPRQSAYAGKCDLCNDIRHFLAASDVGPFAELAPAGYYRDGGGT